MTEQATIDLGMMAERVLRNEDFVALSPIFKARLSTELFAADTSEEREAVYLKHKGFDEFCSLLLVLQLEKDQAVQERNIRNAGE